jgi:hypothetical protein
MSMIQLRSNVPPLLGLVVVAVVAACGAAGGSPTSATPSATPDGITHPTGATEVVLRFDEAGGFVPVEFFAAHVPYFTLYGDGTVVFVSSAQAAVPAPNGVSTGSSIRTARMSETQVQSLLEFALRDGGLAIARTDYPNPNVADAATAVFEIHAAGDSKTVSVMALGLGGEPGADAAVLGALARLGDRLRNFDQGGTLASDPYVPPAYRGVLLEAGGVQGVDVRAWPWSTLTPADFTAPADQGGLQRRIHVLTPDEAAVLGVPGSENGVTGGLWYRGPDGTVYSFVLRPLLPDESA